MKLAMIGLGRMGGNMARRLLGAGHHVVGYNLLPEATRQLAEEAGLTPAYSLEEALTRLDTSPRIAWMMVPAGEPTENLTQDLSMRLEPGDVIIDGGNSNYLDTLRRSKALAEKSLNLIDVGTSGGIWGFTEGYSMMIGGSGEIVKFLRPIFEALAPGKDLGWGHVGPVGAGHFAKMIHNGIEYGLMEAYAEGFELLRARQEYAFDLHQVAEIWRTGSVIRSWLLDLFSAAIADDPELSEIRDWVEDSGEGRWTVMEAINNAIPAPVIALALFRRFGSRQEESYSAKLLAAVRKGFGGHPVVPKKQGVKP